MKTVHIIRILCLIAALVALACCTNALQVELHPNGPNDMGEGPTVETDLYVPGGLPDVLGLNVGQPNTLTRNDRSLVRFDISHLALESNIAPRLIKAELRFTIDASYFRNVPTQIEVSKLPHDTVGGLVGTDLVREPAAIVKILEIKVPHPDEFKLDVTKALRSDLAKGRKFTSYRWRNITAEAKGNTFLDPWFVRVVADPQNLPTLTLTFKEAGKTK